jgi:hypothetical protein
VGVVGDFTLAGVGFGSDMGRKEETCTIRSPVITLVTLTLSSLPAAFLAIPLIKSISNILSNVELTLETGESKTLATFSSLCFLFLGAKFFSDNLSLGGEKSDGVLVSVKDIWGYWDFNI